MGDNFNENLKASREKRGMTQKEVADIIGVAKSTYTKVETENLVSRLSKKSQTL